MDGGPAQTHLAAVSRFTGVPESDALLVNWKSEAFRPVHYLAIDRNAGKIVISIRFVCLAVPFAGCALGRQCLWQAPPSLGSILNGSPDNESQICNFSADSRGTTSRKDFLTDLVGRPIAHEFAPWLKVWNLFDCGSAFLITKIMSKSLVSQFRVTFMPDCFNLQ